MKKLIKCINLIRACYFVMSNLVLLLKNASGIKKLRTSETACFVIGNGPSLTKSLIEHRDKVLASKKICVNDMILTPIVQELRPEYYLLLDPLYFASDASAYYLQLGKDVVKALETLVTWDMILFLPHLMEDLPQFKNIPKVNSRITICYFNNKFPGTFSPINYYLYSCDLCSPHTQNVLVAAIFLMLRLQFKTIYLLGADHSWTKNLVVTNDNVVSFQNDHFYDPTIELKPFYKGDVNNSVFSMSEILRLFSLMFEGYETLNKYAQRLHAEILNATPVSYIDAFRKVDTIN